MNILLIEDDTHIQEMICDFLYSEQYSVDCAENGLCAIAAWRAHTYDLILLDLMLPDASGFEILKQIRRISQVPVLILTAKDSDADKMLGLNLGADDYITKPFSLVELLARIKANIRRATVYNQSGDRKEKVMNYKDLCLYEDTYVVTKCGMPLELTRTEFEILRLLISNQGRAFSKEQLYTLIWKEPYFGNEYVLHTHINRLRHKLAKDGQKERYIKTLWGIGYKMEEER